MLSKGMAGVGRGRKGCGRGDKVTSPPQSKLSKRTSPRYEAIKEIQDMYDVITNAINPLEAANVCIWWMGRKSKNWQFKTINIFIAGLFLGNNMTEQERKHAIDSIVSAYKSGVWKS